MSELRESVVSICDRALAGLEAGAVQTGVARVRHRLLEPLRVAVAGRVSAGKSTLVNALLGQRVAPTAAGECTQVVTWFRYGDADRAELRLRDGSTVPLALRPDRSLPSTLGAELEAVDSVSVWLSNRNLDDMTIIDTPGLATLTESSAARTAELLAVRSCGAVSEADALVYVITHDAREDDRQILAEFRSQFGSLRVSALNTVAVLNKVDKLAGDGADARDAAHPIAERIGRELGPTVAWVTPIVSLLAETTEAGRLDERRAGQLQMLADMPRERRRLALASGRRFVADDTLPLEPAQRRELLALLDLYGLRSAVSAVDTGRTGALPLTDELRTRSGIDDLRSLLMRAFTRRADVLKADAALSALRGLARQTTDRRSGQVLGAELRAGSERLAVLPEMQQLREMEALHQVASGRIQLPSELHEELRRMATGESVQEKLFFEGGAAEDDLLRAAFERADRWRALRNDPRRCPAEKRIAYVMGLSYAALIGELQPVSERTDSAESPLPLPTSPGSRS